MRQVFVFSILHCVMGASFLRTLHDFHWQWLGCFRRNEDRLVVSTDERWALSIISLRHGFKVRESLGLSELGLLYRTSGRSTVWSRFDEQCFVSWSIHITYVEDCLRDTIEREMVRMVTCHVKLFINSKTGSATNLPRLQSSSVCYFELAPPSEWPIFRVMDWVN